MNLPVLAIRNHQLTWLVSSLLILLGLVSYFTMPRAEDPQLDFPMSNIIVVNPGTTAADIESLIVDPIESALNELEDVQEIKSNIEDGLAKVHIEFLYGSDADEKFDDVQKAVNSIRDSLPQGIVKLEISKISPNEVGILQWVLTSDVSDHSELRRLGEKLENRIERVAGVKRVDIEALSQLEVQIQLNPSKLHGLGLSLEQVQQAINTASLNIPGGHVQGGGRRFSVVTSGDFESLEQIENTIISSVNGQPIYLKSIAEVAFKEGLPSYRAFYNGKASIILSVVQRKGSNIFNVSDAVKGVVAEFKASLPSYMKVSAIVDQSISVDERVSGFFANLLQGLLLVAIATIAVLGARASLIVVTAIPVSIFIAIGWLDLSGFALQQMSIVGLVIALGLLVDNAIVVVENVIRHRRNGLSRIEAAERGSKEVGMAILSGTLTTVLSFVPMLLMQNGSGQFIRSMPVTVVLTLVASLVVALTLTPLLSSLLKKSLNKDTRVQQWLNQLADGRYQQVLNFALDYPKRVMLGAVMVFTLALGLFPLIGVSLFPKAEKPMILVNVDLPQGTAFQKTQNAAFEIERVVRQEALVEDVMVNVGRGNPRVYYNVSPDRQTPHFAQLMVKLSNGNLAVVEPFIESLREKLSVYPGVKVSIKEFNQGPPSEAPIEYRVMGENWDAIQQGAKTVETLMRRTDGTINVENAIGEHKVDLKLEINRDKASMLGLPINQIDQNVRAALVGLPMGTYKDEAGDEFTIVLKNAQSEEPELQAFDTLMLKGPTGAMIPLSQVASLQLETNMPSFQHHNLMRTARVTSDIRPGFNTAKVNENILAQIESTDFPAGVYVTVGGEEESREESFGGMAKALIIAMLGIFSVLVMQFKSFKQPLIVFSAIPFAVTGAFFALFITGYTFSFTAFVGLTSLVGIVVNNAIILIDYANQRRQAGVSIQQAITDAAKTRMTPILLTTATTIVGLLPLTLSGSSMWSPMGWAIIGGLLMSTLISLILVPVLYTWFTQESKLQGVPSEESLSTL